MCADACAGCGHTICEHFYSFQVNAETQEYMMDCFLCGKGFDTQHLDLKNSAKNKGSAAPELAGQVVFEAFDRDDDKESKEKKSAPAAAAAPASAAEAMDKARSRLMEGLSLAASKMTVSPAATASASASAPAASEAAAASTGGASPHEKDWET